ncbi:MAG: hypothetical protein ACKVUS_11080 [Saprospiraceae bacterium]
MSKLYLRLLSVTGYLLLPTATVLCLLACGSPNTPLDADTRLRIDSIANAQIARAQVEHDSLCKAAHITQLPHLVDSIKQIRLREIEEQLKTVPK